MKRTKLAKYVEVRGKQTELARAMNMTSSAIQQMIKNGRNIFVLQHDDGTVELEEVKKLTSQVG